MTAVDAPGGPEVAGPGLPTIAVSTAAPAPDVPPPPAAKTPHPFFKKTSEKILERKQARELEASRPIRHPTPTSLPDPESTESNGQKPKRQRKPKADTNGRAKRPKPSLSRLPAEPIGAPPPTSSPVVLQSFRTDIDPMTAAAPLSPIPSSPPPVVSSDESAPNTQEQNLEIDPNQTRRKKRRTTPSASVAIEVDTETGMILRSSSTTPLLFTNSNRPAAEVLFQNGLLTIRAGGRISPEDLLPRFLDAPSSPASPTLPEPISYKLEDLTKRVHWRARYDKDRHMMIFKSSPPPEERPSVAASLDRPLPPAPKNAFALLGKKKPIPKPAPVDPPKTDLDEKSKKHTSARPRKKQTTAEVSAEVPSKTGKHQHTVIDLDSSSPAPKHVSTVDIAPPPPKPSGPKLAHPFFSAAGRKKMQADVPQTPPERSSDSTDISKPVPSAAHDSRKPQTSTASALGIFCPTTFTKHVVKAPGMLEPAWPAKGTSHVRGLEETIPMDVDPSIPRNKKLKSRTVSLAPQENIFAKMCDNLGIRELENKIKQRDYRSNEYLHLPSELRAPKRIVTTSSQLQDMIRPRTHARLPHPKALAHAINMDTDSDSGSEMSIGGGKVHPALMSLYIRLGKELTAFDKNTFDTLPWDAKYAPKSGCEVLQPTREIDVLEAWLIGLRTELFDVPDNRKRRPNKKDACKGVIKKKRKKKDDDLDGFVVTSEEDQNFMDELTDPDEEEGDWTTATAKTKKSTIRCGDRNLDPEIFETSDSKKTNAVLISGPIGCGKTAAVYAVAKELGYTVFEVSPGSRRNGKDLLDLVGDMSRNHLVHQAKGPVERRNPFARAKAAAQESAAKSVTPEDNPRPQQSLILLEEVDILFEEDKTFWTSVITLMAKSKRPIIMTCNDEDVIPLDTLSLHAILRFSKPAPDLMVDYLLLIAANEGHLLQRPCIDSLVHTNNLDLRRCIMDLQFHCRIGVGDRTGTLDWQIVRFPMGCDISENGEVSRVVSVDTYSEGMGWLDSAPGARDEDRWEDVWDGFGVDIGAQESGLESCIRSIDGMDKKLALEVIDEFFTARSVADAFSRGTMSSSHLPRIDTSHPPRTAAAILDDPLGYPVLLTSLHPSTTDLSFSIAACRLAWSYLTAATTPFVNYPPIPNTTTILSAVTRRHESALPIFTPSHYQALFHPFAMQTPKFGSPQVVLSCVYTGTKVLIQDAAPVIRDILRHDIQAEHRRRKDSGLLSAGGKRKTRAARMAFEGRGRSDRPERYFRGVGAEVLVTAGEGWDAAVQNAMAKRQMEDEQDQDGEYEEDDGEY